MAESIIPESEFARQMNVHRSTVNRWKVDGRLVMVGDKVDADASRRRLAETRGGRDDVSQRHAEARGAEIDIQAGDKIGEPEAAQDDNKSEDDTDQGANVEVGTRAYWQARKERALALAAERENEVAMGNLISLQEAEAIVADMVIRFRQSVENLPHSEVPDLIGKDRDAMIAIRKENNRKLLQNLERGFADQLKALGAAEQ